jgi:hypothetical protein
MGTRGTSLAGGDESVRDTLRGPVHQTGSVMNRLTHEISDTPEPPDGSRILRILPTSLLDGGNVTGAGSRFWHSILEPTTFLIDDKSHCGAFRFTAAEC